MHLLNYKLREKNLYFLELNSLNLLLVLFFRLSGIRIYYLTASPFWSKKKHIIRLNKIGIKWMNFHDYNQNLSKGFLSKINKFTEYTKLYLDQKNIFNLIAKEMNLSEKEVHFFTAAITNGLYGKIRLLGELLGLAELYEKNSSGKGWIWIPNNKLSKYFLEKEGRWVNICPKYLTVLKIFIEVIYYIFIWIYNKLDYLNQKKIGILRYLRLANNSHNLKIDDELDKYNVIYFPLGGIDYGKLYSKDQYYSSDKNSPFYPSNILHLSLLREYSVFKKNSLSYINEKNIPYRVWEDIYSIEVKELIMIYFIFFKKYLKMALSEIGLYLTLFLFYNYKAIKMNIRTLECIPKLKIALIGQEVMFPMHVAIACKIKGICTVAVQERMLTPWWFAPMIIDHYFVCGTMAGKVLKERFKNLIENVYEIGPVRISDHYNAIKNTENIKIKLPYYEWRVLVLDYSSIVDYYENGRSMFNNWRNNIKLYQDIIKLCSYFPSAQFLIKGKGHDFIKIPYFTEIKKQIEQTPNCLLIKDYKQWSPFNSVAVSDIAIALHTSLGDEMLALGKPVIFYDYFKFPSELLDYGKEIMSHSIDDLKFKLTEYFSNPEKYNHTLDAARKKYFSISTMTPKAIIQQQLLNFLDNQ